MISVKKSYKEILQVLAGLGAAATQAVANNLTTTSAGSVLDARQGKVLKDSIPTGTAASKGVANNLTTASAGSYVLDAYQGKVLKDSIPTGAAASKGVANNLTTASAGSYVLDAYQGKVLKDSIPTGAAASKGVANNLTTASAGSYVLDAYQGKVLKDSIPTGAAASRAVANNLTTSSAGSYVLDAYQGKVLNDKLTSESHTFSASSYSKLEGSAIVFRVGKLGILFLSSLTGLTASASTDLGITLPAAYRPTSEVTQDCLIAGGTPACVRVTISTAGKVTVYNYTSSTGTRNIRARIPYVCAG
jgi:hypothetical protein